ncbi:MAG: hypothetical protein LBE78_00550 [Burkholderiaceae bacterium]|nr:hypothetical protein [Burkholderiaceae bacterium]
MNVLASDVIGVPGKGECRGSKRTCVRLDGMSGVGLWPTRALQGRGRRMARRARCWRARSALTQKVKVIEATQANIHADLLKITSGQLPFPG